ncbi:MAG TPA: hypothetical protein VJT54_11460 [Verrucomicrobiae bacterium]|nr:hypothetical protein [Verrucomicrobiae bacterium]
MRTPPFKPVVPAWAGVALLLAAVVSVAAQATNGTDFASFQVIGQRNIFDPNRVPHRRSASPAARVVDSFSFVGTMSYAKGTFAFFDGTSTDFRKVLELEGSIADFKVTAISPKSVTLVSGTNETILPLGTQMRRDDDGHWVVSTEAASYASTGNSVAAGSAHRSSGRERYGSSPTGTTITTDNLQPDGSNPPPLDGAAGTGPDMAPDAAPPPGGANDALTRLMRQRAQEEQQLGSGQGQ